MSESPFEAMRIVSVDRRPFDSALDLEKSNFLEYRLTRKLDALVTKEGKSPDLFVIQKIPRRALRGPIAQLEQRPAAQRQLAFRLAVHRIERGDGTVLECDPKWLDEGVNGTLVASEDWLDQVSDEFGDHVIDEMGLVAIDFAKLAKGQHGPFSLRHT